MDEGKVFHPAESRAGGRRGPRHQGALAASVAALIQITTTACAGPYQSASGNRADDHDVLFAVLRHHLEPEFPGACLATPLQGANPDYLERLTQRLRFPPAPADHDAYLADATRLADATHMAFPGAQPITPDDLRHVYPGARLVEGSQCEALITVFRPLIVDNWAFLLVSKGFACSGFTYRMALTRRNGAWTVQHTDLLGSRGGPPGCSTHPWSAPSGLRIERIRITD